MRYLQFLRGVHAALAPATYLEIGVRRGNSLSLAKAPSVGIDPDYDLKEEHAHLATTASLFRETSDDYFAGADPCAPFGGRPIDLAFIDGMHLLEYALRDFINVERHAHWASVIVIDDIFPRRQIEAARDRATRAWTGDVYKLLGILDQHRPDLICLRVDTQPTGLLLALALDPDNGVLSDRYDDIVEEAIVPDPQSVPDAILERRGALDPRAVLAGSFWSVLRTRQTSEEGRARCVRRLRRAVRRDFSPSLAARIRRVARSSA